jgi:hypothetical protein
MTQGADVMASAAQPSHLRLGNIAIAKETANVLEGDVYNSFHQWVYWLSRYIGEILYARAISPL